MQSFFIFMPASQKTPPRHANVTTTRWRLEIAPNAFGVGAFALGQPLSGYSNLFTSIYSYLRLFGPPGGMLSLMPLREGKDIRFVSCATLRNPLESLFG